MPQHVLRLPPNHPIIAQEGRLTFAELTRRPEKIKNVYKQCFTEFGKCLQTQQLTELTVFLKEVWGLQMTITLQTPYNLLHFHVCVMKHFNLFSDAFFL